MTPFSGDTAISVGGAMLLPQSLWVIGTAAVLMIIAGCLISFTLIGKAMLAHIIAKPIPRLKGLSLAMATLGLGIVVNIVLINEVHWTGAPDGMAIRPPIMVQARSC